MRKSCEEDELDIVEFFIFNAVSFQSMDESINYLDELDYCLTFSRCSISIPISHADFVRRNVSFNSTAKTFP